MFDYAAFTSFATNAPNASTGGAGLYVRDIELGTTKRIDLGPGGVAPSSSNPTNAQISSDGKFVVFSSSLGGYVSGVGGSASQIYVSEIDVTPTTPAAFTVTLKKATVQVKGRTKLQLTGKVTTISTKLPVKAAAVNVLCKDKQGKTTLNANPKTDKKGVYASNINPPPANKKSTCSASYSGVTSKSVKIP